MTNEDIYDIKLKLNKISELTEVMIHYRIICGGASLCPNLGVYHQY